tara:strand:+ start:67 stop:237 length:171 start_codon:yes stop_codon:yes gene_type:complete
MKEPENSKAGRTEFDTERQLWVVFNGKEWVEVDLKKHRCNFYIVNRCRNDENINKY